MSLSDLQIGVWNVIGAFGIPTGGKVFFVNASTGSDDNAGTDISQPLKSVRTAYGKTTSGQNDVILFSPSATADIWTTKLDWSNTYTHLIGLHPGWMNNRARITTSTVSKSMTPLVTVSGQGCIFANVMISQEGSNASYNAVPLHVTGHRSCFFNVSVRNIGALAVVENAHRSLTIGSAYDVCFKHCQFGETSYDAVTAASAVIEMTGTDAGKYLFEDCMILGAGSSSAVFVKQGANVGGFTYFNNCLFHNSTISTLDAMTQAFNLSGTGNDGFFLKNCMIIGATNLETSDSGVVYGTPIPAAATGEIATALTG